MISLWNQSGRESAWSVHSKSDQVKKNPKFNGGKKREETRLTRTTCPLLSHAHHHHLFLSTLGAQKKKKGKKYYKENLLIKRNFFRKKDFSSFGSHTHQKEPLSLPTSPSDRFLFFGGFFFIIQHIFLSSSSIHMFHVCVWIRKGEKKGRRVFLLPFFS